MESMRKKMNTILSPAAYNFNKKVVEGLFANGMEVVCIDHSGSSDEQISFEDGIEYISLKTRGNYYLTQLSYFFEDGNIIRKASADKGSFVVCDSVDSFLSFSAALFSRFFRLKCVNIVTDFLYKKNNESIVEKLSRIFFYYANSLCTHYVFLTEQMNEALNKKNKKYIVMEGLVDYRTKETVQKKNNVCLYTGSIEEKYGILNLVKAFKYLTGLDLVLNIYSADKANSTFMNEVNSLPNVNFMGYMETGEVANIQKKAIILVNPRSIEGEYTKFSFPSKTLEYMLSGGVVISSKLAGIPNDYKNHLIFFDSLDPKDIAEKIREIFSLNEKKKQQIGHANYCFVMKNKNNIIQTKRIIELITE